jgi:predicted Zn-dependent protease
MNRTLITFLFLLLVPHNGAAQSDASVKKLEQAAAFIVDNRLDEAEKNLQSLLRTAPNNAAALDLLGTIRAKQGRLDDAETLFNRAVRADNQLVGAHMNLAYLYLLKGMPDKTAIELRRRRDLQVRLAVALSGTL